MVNKKNLSETVSSRSQTLDPSKSVFGNPIPNRVQRKAEAQKKSYLKRFGDDRERNFQVSVEIPQEAAALSGIKILQISVSRDNPQNTLVPENPKISGMTTNYTQLIFPLDEKPLIIGTIRMGYGHFRISLAIAQAARAAGFTPYWFDLHAFSQSTAGRVVAHLNKLYSLGSRLSQKSRLFNTLYWEPLNSQGFRHLYANAKDQKITELMATVCTLIPQDIPFVATHVWPAQAAIHAGLKKVVNVIPDNWPMALHLAQGSIHAVQTPFAWLGYRQLEGMLGKKQPRPMPPYAVIQTGHYIDEDLLRNLEADCETRIQRRAEGKKLRILASIGGAGAQFDYTIQFIDRIIALGLETNVEWWINCGDHHRVHADFLEAFNKRGLSCISHTQWSDTSAFDPEASEKSVEKLQHHFFCHPGIFEAVYTTNLLMPACDLLLSKPSELAYYPVPKLLIKRIGGHEAWGAIHAQELGDSSRELKNPAEAAQVLQLMLADPEVLVSMNQNILRSFRAGIYNGAQKVIRLATEDSPLSKAQGTIIEGANS